MARNRQGSPVREIRTSNPLALEIVNSRANRDHIDASTAAALIIIESQNQHGQDTPSQRDRQEKNPASFLDGAVNK